MAGWKPSDDFSVTPERAYQSAQQLGGETVGGGTTWGGLGDNQAGTSNELGQAWGGDPNQQTQHVCPACGYCPCCGRSRYYPPLNPPWPGYPHPYIGDIPSWYTPMPTPYYLPPYTITCTTNQSN